MLAERHLTSHFVFEIVLSFGENLRMTLDLDRVIY